ncbi:sulfurtransferase-like selenium metabolism protein YedF [Alkalibacter mobilis]|uniref:sulfurtransferase-like selenium metabolism protein YedF n=1 Tax=Alkalibacter mobilis TaxID=2787712 RepID=UPI0018A0FDC2|nr:sulfurtransferase-like selenium metabolism protein YedF [Alkalibacter mobilis]MBF7096468.1 sulfurtransferase-like selenium metabolism protein YedF [Alkalibacter mobilis]
MKRELNEMGKACPIPVIETKNMLASMHDGDILTVLVDNYIAVQNITKMAAQLKLDIESRKINDKEYSVDITVKKNAVATDDIEDVLCLPDSIRKNTVIMLGSDKFGEGDDDLGRILMKGYIYALTELEKLPQTVIMYNSGARLSSKASESVGDLKILESQGVEILTCGTCIDYLGLDKDPEVGTVTNMYVIAEKISEATKLIRP